MSVRLYVGNLPKEVIEREALQEMFVDAGDAVSTKVIKDRKTGKCRGFAFVTVPTDEMADKFIEDYSGKSFMESVLKIEKALPRSKGNKNNEEEQTETPAPVVTNNSGSNSGARRQKNKRSQRKTSTQTQNDSVQPDPRWADKLAELKERLAAQATT